MLCDSTCMESPETESRLISGCQELGQWGVGRGELCLRGVELHFRVMKVF